MRELLQVSSLDNETREIFREFDTQYVLVESNRPLNIALMPQNSGFDEIYSNRVFKLWRARMEARPFNRAGSAGEASSLLAQAQLPMVFPSSPVACVRRGGKLK